MHYNDKQDKDKHKQAKQDKTGGQQAGTCLSAGDDIILKRYDKKSAKKE